MSDDQQPTQRTEKGHEIPVPKRGEFFRNLRKVLKPPPESPGSAGRSQEDRPKER